MFTLHACLGQCLGAGVIDMWHISPIFHVSCMCVKLGLLFWVGHNKEERKWNVYKLHNLFSGDRHCIAGVTGPHWYLQHCGCVLDVYLLPRLLHHKTRQLPVGWALWSIPRR
jgi:hypothetical protein